MNWIQLLFSWQKPDKFQIKSCACMKILSISKGLGGGCKLHIKPPHLCSLWFAWIFHSNLRLDQNNCLVPVGTQPTLAQNALNRWLVTFLRAPARNRNHGESWNEIVKSWWRYVSNSNRWCKLGVHGFYLGYRKLITRICPKARNVPFHS